MTPLVEGFLLQASLILALGAQNLFVLESGLKKRRHLLVAFVCSVCDSVLIAIGVAGAASIFVQVPILKSGFGILGVAFLAYYGIKKIVEGVSAPSVVEAKPPSVHTMKQTVLLALGFSLLNPHVYLDTVVLIGGYSSKFPDLARRLEFGAGAASFSILWFFGLALFASYLSGFLKSQRRMRFVSLISGLILLGLSLKLGQEVYSWLAQLR